MERKKSFQIFFLEIHKFHVQLSLQTLLHSSLAGKPKALQCTQQVKSPEVGTMPAYVHSGLLGTETT
jgi:hypothetical protein